MRRAARAKGCLGTSGFVASQQSRVAWGPQALFLKQRTIGGKRRKEPRSPANIFTGELFASLRQCYHTLFGPLLRSGAF